MFDYFYGQSGEMFSYFRVPKILFRDIPVLRNAECCGWQGTTSLRRSCAADS